MKTLMILAVVVALLPGAATADPDLKKGADWFHFSCQECHKVGNVGYSAFGPDLTGVVGRKAGSLPGYTYTPAMLAKAATGLVWTPENINTWITKPADFIPGTAMDFFGVIRQSDRDNIIAYLQTFSPDWKPDAASEAAQ